VFSTPARYDAVIDAFWAGYTVERLSQCIDPSPHVCPPPYTSVWQCLFQMPVSI